MISIKKEFLEVLEKYQGIIHKVSLIYFPNPSDRSDNFQEIVYHLWRGYPNLKKKSSIGSWIYAVSINNSISRLRNKNRIVYHDQVPEIKEHQDPYDSYNKNEEVQQLLQAVQQLDDINKSVILLYLEEKSYDEIAEIIGITKSNVGVRINRAKSLLKQYLTNLRNGK